MTYDVVTNGLNICKYINDIKDSDISRACLSVDSLKQVNIRNTSQHILRSIELLLKYEINTEIFIDVHKNNIHEVVEIINTLHDIGVKNFFIRPVMPIGNGKNLTNIVSKEEYDKLLEDLIPYGYIKDLFITFSTKPQWYIGLDSDTATMKNYNYCIKSGDENMYGNLSVLFEFYCGRYETQITVTPDGYVLGCGTEVSSKHYDKIASGNIKEKPLKQCIEDGKTKSLDYLKNKLDVNSCVHCPHNFYCL